MLASSFGGADERQIQAISNVLIGAFIVAAICAAAVGTISVMLQPTSRFNAIDRSKAGWVAVVLLVPFGFVFYLMSIRPKLLAVGSAPVVSSRPQSAASREVVYDMSGWSEDDQAGVFEQLEQRGVRFELEGDDLVVDVRHEQMVDMLVSEFDVIETVPPQVAYATEYWSPVKFASVTGQLKELGIDHFFDDGELIVDKDDEAAVDRVLDVPDDPPTGE